MVLYQELETKMGEVMLCPLLNKAYDPAVAATGVVSEASKKPLPVVLAEIQVRFFSLNLLVCWCLFLIFLPSSRPSLTSSALVNTATWRAGSRAWIKKLKANWRFVKENFCGALVPLPPFPPLSNKHIFYH